MNLAEALNVYFNPTFLMPGDKSIASLPQHRGNIDDSTKAQYDALEWCDTRPKPKWEELVELMKLASHKEALMANSIEARVKALEDATR